MRQRTVSLADLKSKARKMYEENNDVTAYRVWRTLDKQCTVRTCERWLDDFKFGKLTHLRDAAVHTKSEIDRRGALERLQAEVERFGHYYDDTHVQLLGDPPLHRSALGRKMGLSA